MFEFEYNLTLILIVLGGIALVPLWLHHMWKTIRALIEYWESKRGRPESGSGRERGSRQLAWMQRKGVLFFVGTFFLFSGVVLTILFKNRIFVPLIVSGMLFLSGLFFYCHFSTYSKKERSLFSVRANGAFDTSEPEQLLLFTHPVWNFDNPLLFLTGVIFQLSGVALTFTYGDVFFLLLSAFGVVFWLHLWSFYQLNTVTITNKRTTLKQGFPADSTLEVLHSRVSTVQTSQGLLQRLCRVGTVVISSSDRPDMIVNLKNPEGVKDLIESSLSLEERQAARADRRR